MSGGGAGGGRRRARSFSQSVFKGRVCKMSAITPSLIGCFSAAPRAAVALFGELLDARGRLPPGSSREAQLQAQPRRGRQQQGRREAGARPLQASQVQVQFLGPAQLGLRGGFSGRIALSEKRRAGDAPTHTLPGLTPLTASLPLLPTVPPPEPSTECGHACGGQDLHSKVLLQTHFFLDFLFARSAKGRRGRRVVCRVFGTNCG